MRPRQWLHQRPDSGRCDDGNQCTINVCDARQLSYPSCTQYAPDDGDPDTIGDFAKLTLCTGQPR